MSVFKAKADGVKKFDVNKTIQSIISEDFVKEWIIEANQNQLAEKGEAADGRKLETYASVSPDVYSRTTIFLKKFETGLAKETGHVTLFDTGRLYNSFRVDPKTKFFKITANFRNIADNLDITGVLGLNDQNMDILIKDIVLPRLIQRLKNVL